MGFQGQEGGVPGRKGVWNCDWMMVTFLNQPNQPNNFLVLYCPSFLIFPSQLFLFLSHGIGHFIFLDIDSTCIRLEVQGKGDSCGARSWDLRREGFLAGF